MNKTYITESTSLIAIISAGAVVANQVFNLGASDSSIAALAGAIGGVIVPLILHRIHKRKGG